MAVVPDIRDHSINTAHLTIGRAQPFAVTSCRRSGGRPVYDVHVSSSLAPVGYGSRLKRRLKSENADFRIRVRRYGQRQLWRSPNLAALIAPMRSGEIMLDPTGVVRRARALVDFAEALRSRLGDSVDGVYWEATARALFVVFNRARHVADGCARREELAELEKAVRQLLLEHAGAEAARYIVGVRLGFDVPGGDFVPIDDLSHRRGSRTPVRRRMGQSSTLALLLGAVIPATAAAQPVPQSAPAVSAPNWDIGITGGERDGDGAFLFEGNYTAPLGYSTGFRVDGAAGSTDEGFLGGAALHYFRRDPSTGLFGGFFNWSTVDPNDGVDDQKDLFELGAESEVYSGNITLSAMAGYQFSSDIADGLFGTLRLEWYATDNFMLSAGGRLDPERDGLATFAAEYQPGYAAMPGLSFYGEAAVGGHDYEHVFGGIRYYFGAPKSLKDRHRYDTFRTQASKPGDGTNVPGATPPQTVPRGSSSGCMGSCMGGCS